MSAFAIGHSITLALATFGLVHVPGRLVESLIAVSILVSAIHALRPLIPRGEAFIAAGFGLVHGLAFATLLGGLGLTGGALASSLLGFNLGIEATQLLVVALMMPSLYVLSQTAAYGPLRVAVALSGLALSGAWLLERTTLIGSDPFAPFSEALVAHPFTVAAGFALLAAAARYLPSPGRHSTGHALPLDPPRGRGATMAAAEPALRDIAYAGTSPAQRLDLYRPADAGDPWPLVVQIHGGAFAMGDKTMGADESPRWSPPATPSRA